jgi:hypothetical protein
MVIVTIAQSSTESTRHPLGTEASASRAARSSYRDGFLILFIRNKRRSLIWRSVFTGDLSRVV